MPNFCRRFYPRWRSYETMTASALQFSLDDDQWARDWDMVLQQAGKPGAALDQVFVYPVPVQLLNLWCYFLSCICAMHTSFQDVVDVTDSI